MHLVLVHGAPFPLSPIPVHDLSRLVDRLPWRINRALQHKCYSLLTGEDIELFPDLARAERRGRGRRQQWKQQQQGDENEQVRRKKMLFTCEKKSTVYGMYCMSCCCSSSSFGYLPCISQLNFLGKCNFALE